MARIMVLLITGVVFLIPLFSLAADVYIWTDKNGVTHMEDQAPKGVPQDRIKVEKQDLEPESGAAPVVNPEVGVSTPELSPEEAEAAAKKEKEQKDKELQRQQAIEKARQEYEEAKAQEGRYLYKWKNADTSATRHYWKSKLDDLEEKRRQLEELENAE
jgi:cell division protein FtsN